MSVCFEKARELGELLLHSGYSLRLSDAEAAFGENPTQEAKMDWLNAENDYKKFVEQVANVLKATAFGSVDISSGTENGTGCGTACHCGGCH